MIALAITVIALATAAATAHAASTRAEYVAQVDQTCSLSQPQFEKVAQRVNKMLKNLPSLLPSGSSSKESLRKLNRFFKRIARAQNKLSRIFASMVERIALIAPAPGDEAAVAQWVNGLRQYVQLGRAANRAGKQGKFFRSLSLVQRSLTALDTGGAAVQGFGISVCPTSADSPLF